MDVYTRALAHFLSVLNYEVIPGNIADKVKWVMIDNLGILLGATSAFSDEMEKKFPELMRDLPK